MSNPGTELDMAVNKLRTKYHSYIVENDVEDVGVKFSFYISFYREISRVTASTNVLTFICVIFLSVGCCEVT